MPVPLVKLVLEGSTMSVYPTNATARVRYRIEMTGRGALNPTPSLMAEAVSLCPRIGSIFPGGVIGPPVPTTRIGFPAGFVGFQLRLANHALGSVHIQNREKYYVDCLYESRPMPVIERGCSATQKKTGTYVDSSASGGNSIFARKQMVLDWTAPVGVFSKGISGAPVDPPAVLPFLRSPVSGSRMEFGSSFRISSTFYNNELTQPQIDGISWKFGTAINSFPLFYRQVSGVDDSRLWLCTSINSVTNDGGYSTRLSGEFVFNEAGWDTIAVFEVPYSDQPAILDDAVLTNLARPLFSGSLSIPAPYLPPHGGAGRWPQQFATDLVPLVGFLSQGTLLAPMPSIDQLLK